MLLPMSSTDRRKKGPEAVSDAVREAVERTLEATLGPTRETRERAQQMVDEVGRRAEAGAEAVRERVKDAFDQSRPVTGEDIAEIRVELRSIGKRLAAIEKKIGKAKRTPASAKAAGKAGARKKTSKR